MHARLRTVSMVALAISVQAQQWEPCASLPTPRMDAASAVINDTLYVIGGRHRGGGGFGMGNQGIEDVVEAYVPGENRWRTGFPSIPMPLADMAFVVLEQRVYLLGGTSRNNEVMNTVVSWKPGEAAWQVLDDTLAVPIRGAVASTVDGVSALIVGGSDSSGNFLNIAYRFTPGIGFSPEPPLAQARSGAGAGTLGGQVVVAGGYFHGPLSSTEVFSERTWLAGPGLPSPRGSALSCQQASWLFLLGGQGTGGPLREVLVLEPASDEWNMTDPMSSTRSRLAGGIVGGYVVAAGGAGSVGYEATGTCERARLEALEAQPHHQDHPVALVLAWPNPFRDEVEVSADLSAVGRWTIALHGLDGRMFCRAEGVSSVAHARFRADADMPCGIYMLTIDAGTRLSRPLLRIW